MMMKRGVLTGVLTLLCAGIGTVQAQGVTGAQKRAASEYLAAVATGEPQNVAYAIHPADLEALRTRLLTQLREEAQKGDNTIRARLFGAGLPLAEIERYTTINFYTTLARKLVLAARPYADHVWLATVADREEAVNVLLRGKPARERGKVQVVEVVTLKPYGKDWKAALPSEIEAQIDDLINGRQPVGIAALGLRNRAQQLAGPVAAPGSVAADAGSTLPAITQLLGAAEKSLTDAQCEPYYRQHMSPHFRRITGKKALEALIGSCQRSLGTREMLLSTLRIVRGLTPRYEYDGKRAVYDLAGQGLPFDRFVLEQVDKRWYIAE